MVELWVGRIGGNVGLWGWIWERLHLSEFLCEFVEH
jgi:hypothetical protein